MKIEIPSSWQELNEWQLEEIVNLYPNLKTEDFEKTYIKMVLVLFQKKKGFWHSFKLQKLLRNVPYICFDRVQQILIGTTFLHQFPEIKGLKKNSR